MPKFLRKTGFFLYNDGNRKTCIYQLKSIQPPDSKELVKVSRNEKLQNTK